MANELHYPGETGLNVYAFGWRPTDNKVWDVSLATDAFASFALANWSDYAIVLSEIASGARLYEADWNPGTTAGNFHVIYYKRLGTTPAANDETVGTATLLWDGTVEVVDVPAIETATASASSVLLVNMALTYLGVERITSLSDANPRARAANAIYTRTRDAVIAMHRWNSTTRRTSVNELDVVEVFAQESVSYQLPNDCVRMVRVENLEHHYKLLADNQILTNESALKIEYIASIEDVQSMDELLKHAIAWKLAADMAIALKGDAGLRDRMQSQFEKVLNEARFIDSDQHYDGESIGGSTWLGGRLSETSASWEDSI